MIQKFCLVAGARPNFMKIAPLIHELIKKQVPYTLVHTGQHYDTNMSKVFFDDLKIPLPDYYLNVGSASHAVQTAKIMIEFEKFILKERPMIVVVVGDVNSTIACALVAKKLGIKIAHVEAGLRSFDQTMPEEINRILTDQLSDFLFITEESAMVNLINEGINPDKIFFVGNVMIDTLIKNLEKANKINVLSKFKLENKNFALVTFHRPSNVDQKEDLQRILEILGYLQEKLTIFFPIHPRTKKNIDKFKLGEFIKNKNIILSEPISYLDFLSLMNKSRMLLTDSGGIQEEASYLRVPILTVRNNTERPITIDKGTNTLVGKNLEEIKVLTGDILNGRYKKGEDIEKWDGHSAERIIKILIEALL
ncbi:MAG: non-hydrolyzing UDP-N-acetylglucosamine 2-epimerase [Candidatus Heimdallarchaeota archaeon]